MHNRDAFHLHFGVCEDCSTCVCRRLRALVLRHSERCAHAETISIVQAALDADQHTESLAVPASPAPMTARSLAGQCPLKAAQFQWLCGMLFS